MNRETEPVAAVSEWSELAAARAAVRAAVGALSPDLVDAAELVASELLTNALLHGGGRGTIAIAPVDGGIRITVADGERRAPVVALASDASMTGRGLRLVAANSSAWGVTPLADGKEVWASITSGVLPEADPDLSFQLFDDPEWTASELEAGATAAADTRITVTLGEVPTDLLLRAKTHVDNLIREFRLASATTVGPAAGVPDHLAELIETVVHRFSEAREGIKRQAVAAHDAGQRRTRLELHLSADAAEAGEAYVAALDEVDAYCRAMRLLTLETPPEQRVFRRWYVEELVRQLRAATGAGPPTEASTLEDRLLQEVAQIAASQRASERSARLAEVAVALSKATSPEGVADVVLREGVAALAASGAGVILPGAGDALRVAGTVGYDEVLVERLRQEAPDADLPAAYALRTGEAVWLESPEERDRRFPGLHVLERSTISMCAVPLLIAEQPVGALRFSFATARLFDDEERKFVRALAAQCAQALDRTRLERKAQEDHFRLAVDSMLDPVMMCRPERDDRGTVIDLRVEYVNPAAAGTSGDALGLLLSEFWPTIREHGLLDLYIGVAESGTPLILDSFAYRDPTTGDDEVEVFDIRATRIGDLVLIVYRNVTERATRERVILRHREALAEAQRIAKVGSWRWDAATGSAEWSDEFFAICGLSPAAVEPARERFLELLGDDGRVALDEAIAGSVQTGSQFQIEQRIVRPDGEVRDLVITGEAAAGPGGRVSVTRGTIQDVTDRRFVESALRRSEERLRRERENIEILQAAILPSHLPEIPGAVVLARYVAASQNSAVGGDFYDAFILQDGRVLLAVGDVAGKGIEAAEAVGQLRNSLRMAAIMDPDPERLVGRLNDLVSLGFEAPFATAVIGLYTPDDGAFCWASAGHLPLVVRGPAGDVRILGQEPTHPPLGVERTTLHTVHETTLEPGAVLLLFSDGLVERRGEHLDVGLDRLARSVEAAPRAVDAIPSAVLEANVDDEHRQDDVCLLLLARVGGRGSAAHRTL